MAWCKIAVTPLLTHWSYCILALSHWYLLKRFFFNHAEQNSKYQYTLLFKWCYHFWFVVGCGELFNLLLHYVIHILTSLVLKFSKISFIPDIIDEQIDEICKIVSQLCKYANAAIFNKNCHVTTILTNRIDYKYANLNAYASCKFLVFSCKLIAKDINFTKARKSL